MEEQLDINLDEYIHQGKPSRREAAYAWSTAIGLQTVDGLKTSEYLNDLARLNIEGKITIDEVDKLLKSYYESMTIRDAETENTEEADKASTNIKRILSTDTLNFTANGFISLHRRIFEGVFKHAGELRKYDISKREWVLDLDSVRYLNWEDVHRALEYDIEQEREFTYRGKTKDEIITHLARFVSGIWQIHAFREGNTRTTAVFTILYLRSLGFNVENDLFAKHSWYFRNALVRANYKNVVKGIDYTPIYLERFFRNLLLGEQWDLRNRYLHIQATADGSDQPNLAAPDKHPTSTRQVPDMLHTDDPNIMQIIHAIGESALSVKEMMTAIELKNRENFVDNYLNPAIAGGYVRLLYPDKPRHPRQKYLLTVKGMTLYNELGK